MSELSDFKLAELLIRKACRIKSLPMKDVMLVFKEPSGVIDGGALHVGESSSLGYTLYSIVQAYVNNDKQILGRSLFQNEDEKNEFLVYAATTLRRAIRQKSQSFEESKPQELFLHRLYQRPLVWSVMKNLICPIYQCPLKNIKVVGGTSAYTDVSRYFEEGEVDDPNAPKDEFVFVNDDVDNFSVKNACLLIEVIKAHEISPSLVMIDLFSSDLYKKLLGIAQLSLIDDEEVSEFAALIFDLLDLSLDNYPHVYAAASKSNIKTAQSWDMPYRDGVQWWYFGLPEQMLSPTRGSDWSTHVNLEPWAQEFWSEVEKIKSKKSQGEGVNFNDLLRLKHLQTGEYEDVSRTLQALLSEQRIW